LTGLEEKTCTHLINLEIANLKFIIIRLIEIFNSLYNSKVIALTAKRGTTISNEKLNVHPIKLTDTVPSHNHFTGIKAIESN